MACGCKKNIEALRLALEKAKAEEALKASVVAQKVLTAEEDRIEAIKGLRAIVEMLNV